MCCVCSHRSPPSWTSVAARLEEPNRPTGRAPSDLVDGRASCREAALSCRGGGLVPAVPQGIWTAGWSPVRAERCVGARCVSCLGSALLLAAAHASRLPAALTLFVLLFTHIPDPK